MSVLELLEQLHEAMARDLLARVADGTDTAADLGVAAKLLKDSNVTAMPVPGSASASLKDKLNERASQNHTAIPPQLDDVDRATAAAFSSKINEYGVQ